MTRKVVITLIVLGILLFGVIVLHVLSTFYSFTLFGLEEEQYKALVSDAIFVLALCFALVPLFQASQNTFRLKEEQYKALVSDAILVLAFVFALGPLFHVSKKARKLRQEVTIVQITGNRCYRCGHEWRPRDINVRSTLCPACKSPYWDTARSGKSG